MSHHMLRPSRFHAAALAACFALGLAGRGHADTDDGGEEYRRAIEQAVAAFDAADLATARSAFEHAHSISPNARTFRGIAVTAFRQGDFFTAVIAFRSALADTRKPLTAEQRNEATTLLRQAERQIGHVTVVTVPGNATARLDGRVVDAGRELDVPTGTHVFRADLPGYRAVEREKTVAAGARMNVELELQVESSPAGATVPAPVAKEVPPVTTKSKGRVWTWVALGAAPVLGGVGLGVWLSGLSAAKSIRDCTSCTWDDVQHKRDEYGLPWKQTFATVSGIAAGAALGGAVVLYFVEGKSTDGPPPSVAFGLSGTGAYASGAF